MPVAARRLGLVVLCTTLFHLQLFARPFYNADEAIYSAIANRLNTGAVLYRDVVDHMPPATVYTYALTYRLFGRNAIHAIHVLCIAWIFVTAWLCWLVARRLALALARSPETAEARLYAERVGLAAALLYGAYTSASIPKWFLAVNRELLMQLPVTAAVALLLVAGPRWWRWLVAGALVSVGALYKPQGIFTLVPLAWLALHPDGGRTWLPSLADVRRGASSLVVLGVGAIVPFAAVGLAFLAAGALDDLRFWIGYASRYAASVDLGAAGHSLLARGAFFCVTLPVLPLGAYLALRWNRGARSPTLRVVIVWLVAAFLAVCVGGRFFAHYFIQLLPPLCILAAVGLVAAYERLSRRAWRGALVALAFAPPVVFFLYAPHNDDYLQVPQRDRTVPAHVGEFVRNETSPDARLFVWGNYTEIYFYADRVAGTRFVYANYQTGKMWGTPTNEEDAPLELRRPFIVQRSWDLLLEDLKQAPPDVIVDAAAGGLYKFRGLPMTSFPALRDVLGQYRLLSLVDGVPVYVRAEVALVHGRAAARGVR